ncbi:MAG: hypothetical protein RIT45_2973 [Pseudomonadota bacterium]|jgi:hypothetical protein
MKTRWGVSVRQRRAWAGLVVAMSAAWLPTGAAWACGGCFAPTLPPGPGQPLGGAVVQNAERVVFVQDAKTGLSRVWVEVRYTGAAEEFGWVLPLPEVPTVTVGTSWALDRLDDVLAARFQVLQGGNENCRDPQLGCVPQEPDAGWVDTGASDAFTGGGPNGGGNPSLPGGVFVLAQGQAGPYDYVVVGGFESEKLIAWLQDNGYKIPTTAGPIVQSHADKGDVFLAIKLQSGKGIELIRPVVLTMQNAEPCVPLRLTSIAAAAEMSVIVTAAGPGRALAKNMLHFELNPALINWLGGVNNVEQMLSAAADEAAGRGFFTDAAMPSSTLTKQLPPVPQLEWVEGKTNLYQLAVAYAAIRIGNNGSWLATAWAHRDFEATFGALLGLPEHFEANFPGALQPSQAAAQLAICGAIWSGIPMSNPSDKCPIGNFSKFWDKADAQKVAVDPIALKSGLEAMLIDSYAELRLAIATTSRTTRLSTRIGPEEMDRDPVFAFNPDLPDVAPLRTATRNPVCSTGWLPADQVRLTIPGMGSWRVGAQTPWNTVPWKKDAPFALAISVLDESGPPITIDPSQIELVDTALLQAVVGAASPAKALVLKPATAWQPQPSDPALVNQVTPWKQPWGCEPRVGWVDGACPPASYGLTCTGGVGGGGSDGGATSDGSGTGGNGSDCSGACDGLASGSDAAGGTGGDGTGPDKGTSSAKGDGGCSAGAPSGGGPLAWTFALLAAILALGLRRSGPAEARRAPIRRD